MAKYQSDIIMGEKYRDPYTGFEGVATSVTFYSHGCERVALEIIKDGEIKFESFDATRIIHCATEKQPKSERTGGPGGREATPPRSGRAR